MSRLSLKYGIIMAISFIAFFLVMNAFGLGEEYHLRVLNGLLHVGFLYFLIREWQEKHGRPKKQYLGNMTQGIVASAIGAGIFAVFIVLFLTINQSFMANLRDTVSLTQHITPVSAAMFVFVEGVAVGLIVTYIMTRVVDYQLKVS
jgi:glucan phosphoethanolaminetransferase (alkaline phosphatase superfamily)